ncbi:hypothetical protein A7K94_0206185 [Modestobacter sp. VKM Ac-2676]|nr:hypothetical protein A7K94_0206185 [Modestobacter sp. VKM Ac-2676]
MIATWVRMTDLLVETGGRADGTAGAGAPAVDQGWDDDGAARCARSGRQEEQRSSGAARGSGSGSVSGPGHSVAGSHLAYGCAARLGYGYRTRLPAVATARPSAQHVLDDARDEASSRRVVGGQDDLRG